MFETSYYFYSLYKIEDLESIMSNENIIQNIFTKIEKNRITDSQASKIITSFTSLLKVNKQPNNNTYTNDKNSKYLEKSKSRELPLEESTESAPYTPTGGNKSKRKRKKKIQRKRTKKTRSFNHIKTIAKYN